MYNYTFIIPHKNCPDLLQRCVDSIPERDDVQVIVIDDNSDVDKKPLINRADVEVILLDATQSKGAGRARNEGMKRAKGKWLLFADCDDFYAEGFLHVLDRYKDSDLEALYFNASSVDSRTMKATSGRVRPLNTMVENSLDDEEAFFKLRCFYNAPWAKMTRRAFIVEQEILFEETLNGNDMMYSHYVGCLAKKCAVIADELFIYTTSNNGLSDQKSMIDAWLSRINNNYKQREYLRFIGHPEWKDTSFFHFYCRFFKYRPLVGIKVLFNHYKNKDKFGNDKMKYVNFLKAHGYEGNII